MAEQIQTHTTASAYFQLAAYKANDLIQLIEGAVVIDMPPVPRHQEITGEVFFLLLSTAKQKSGKAYTAPIEVYLDENNVYEPDVLYLKPDSACKITEKRLVGAPDLVVEVLSPSTGKRDRHEKYHAYERSGVAEYWIVDPLYDVIEVYINDGQHFKRYGAFGHGDSFDSVTLSTQVIVDTLITHAE